MAGLEAEQKSRTAAIEADAAIKSRQAAMEAKNQIGALEAENLRQQNQRSQSVEESKNQLKLVRVVAFDAKSVSSCFLFPQAARCVATDKMACTSAFMPALLPRPSEPTKHSSEYQNKQRMLPGQCHLRNVPVAQVQLQYAQEQACRQQEADMAPRQKQMELDKELCKAEAQRQTEYLRSKTLASVCEALSAHAKNSHRWEGFCPLNALSCRTAASIYAPSSLWAYAPYTTC